MSVSVEKTGATVDEAVQAALRELSAEREHVLVDVMEEGDGIRPFRVLVTLEEEDAPQYYGDEVGSEHDMEEQCEAAGRRFLEQVLDQFNLSYHIEAQYEEDSLQFDVEGEDCGIIIGRGGDTLAALQYMTTLVVNRQVEQPVHVHVDVGGYRRRHEESLVSLARRTAAKVARSGRTFEMTPMNPADRRVIHSALQDFRGVTTFSEGSGEERRVIIAPNHES